MIRICGPKLANCCFLLSLWGVIMLLLLGVFFSTRSVALVDDLPKMEETKGYKSSARNCFIAAGIYVVTMVLAAHQKWVNSRTGDTQKLIFMRLVLQNIRSIVAAVDVVAWVDTENPGTNES